MPRDLHPLNQTRLHLTRLEDRLTPAPVPLPDPDDQISEITPGGHVNDMGIPSPGWSYTHDDLIFRGLASSDRLNWGEYLALNSTDVDVYRIEVRAGDRIRFRADAPEVTDVWTDPPASNDPNPQPKTYRHRATLRLALYDDTLMFPPSAGGDPTITLPIYGTTTYELNYTFPRSGTYYLGISQPGNNRYDMIGGENDTPGEYLKTFGPYTLTADYDPSASATFPTNLQVEPMPANFNGTADGVLVVRMAFNSSTGNIQDLFPTLSGNRSASGIEMREMLRYDYPTPNPFPDQHPSQAVPKPESYWRATSGEFLVNTSTQTAYLEFDAHGYTMFNDPARFMSPMIESAFSGYQQYQYRLPWMPSGAWIDVGPVYEIVRRTDIKNDPVTNYPRWWYSVTKGGYTRELELGLAIPTPDSGSNPNTTPTPTPGAKPGPAATQTIAIGPGTSGASTVLLYPPGGAAPAPVAAFPRPIPGGVRTAVADFNGDGTDDLVAGTGPGVPSLVRVIDGQTHQEIFAIGPFEPAFTGGVYVAAGDIDGDGVPDLVITPDEGGGPRVRLFAGKGFAVLADFFAIDDPNFRGGARATVGDLTGDGRGDLLVSAGFGGGPRVAAYGGSSLANGVFATKPFGDFFLFEPELRNGAFVSLGDIDADGFADVVGGGGPGGGPRVYALSGRALVQAGSQVPLTNFFAGDVSNRGGVRVSVKDLDGDKRADIVTGAGSGAGSRVTTYLGATISADGTPPASHDFEAFAGLAGGVFVG